MQIGRVISIKLSYVAITQIINPQLNKLYNYSKKIMQYIGNPTEEFRTILLGYHIKNIDHISLTRTVQQKECHVCPVCIKKSPHY